MSSPLRARVNDSLQSAAAMLSLAEQPQLSLDVSASRQRSMFVGAAQFFLVRAYRVFLAEILLGYQQDVVPASAQEALTSLAAQGRHSGELQALHNLEQTGWLGDMMRAEAAFALSPGAVARAVSGSAGSVGSPSLAVDVGEADSEQARALGWLRQLQGLVLEYSDLLDEW